MHNWIVVIRFKDMPEDADAESMSVFLDAFLDTNGAVDAEAISMKKEEKCPTN